MNDKTDIPLDLIVLGISGILTLKVVAHLSWPQALGFTASIVVFYIIFHTVAHRIVGD